MGLFKANNNEAVEGLSKLAHMDYSSKNAHLADMYKRLCTGRKAFANVYDLNVAAVTEVSALDREIQFYTKQLEDITQNIVNATHEIHDATSDSSEVAAIVSGRHEDLTNTIISVSESSDSVYHKIEEGQEALTEIRSLSDSTISASETMHADMKELAEVLEKMNEVIDAINSISAQTNLLSLNASIEAARAGEAGRGFAVVADEIRSLADETKGLTQNMGQFVEGVRHASQKSAESVEVAINSLSTVNEKIKRVWAINEENQSHVAAITESISSLAAVSEEISSSMNEIEAKAAAIEETCGLLKEDAVGLHRISDDCKEAILPLAKIETGVDRVLKQMGQMTLDPFYALNRDELVAYIDGAVAGHRTWVEKLSQVVSSKVVLPIQLNEAKCRFGHFYYSIEPPIPELKVLWTAIGKDHQELHKCGSDAINAMFADNYSEAESCVRNARNISASLISKLTDLKAKLPEQTSELK